MKSSSTDPVERCSLLVAASMVLLVLGGVCFVAIHLMPVTSSLEWVGPDAEAVWVSMRGWEIWPYAVEATSVWFESIGASGVSFDYETPMIAGLLMGGLVSVISPFLFPVFRRTRLILWIVVVVALVTIVAGPGLLYFLEMRNTVSDDYFRWEPGIYIWMGSCPLTLLGLVLLPVRKRPKVG